MGGWEPLDKPEQKEEQKENAILDELLFCSVVVEADKRFLRFRGGYTIEVDDRALVETINQCSLALMISTKI